MQIDPLPEVKCDFTEAELLDPFIRTGNYNSETRTITIFVKNRQLKDILRSFCHELVHHSQNVSDPEGFAAVDKGGKLVENDQLTMIETDAYTRGNILFRKWTETFQNS